MIVKRATLSLVCALAPGLVMAQSNQSPSVVLPTVIVTAQKEASDIREVPASVTAVTASTIRDSGLLSVTEAAIFAPNTIFTEFTARKVSNGRVRGVGSSPANPAITTYLDGVPQLNSNTSNIELIDVGQIEFVRGPQSPLFGRNTLGGIVNVTSAKPSMSQWTGAVTAPIGNHGLWDVRGNISGPLGDKAAISFAAGKQQRDGFTTNGITGNKIDARDGTFTKAQVLLVPNANWEARLIHAYERDRDGDYALGDLTAIRNMPFVVARDFEGFTNRDINNTTVNLRGIGQNFSIESTTGFIRWNTEDQTDLDYSPLALARRSNSEESTQFTQQVRISSPENTPLTMMGSMDLKWQAGIEYFNQGYAQDAVNSLSPFVLSPQINFAVAMHSPQADIDTTGIGLFGRATLTFNEKADVTAGVRFDHESSDAHLNTFFAPAIAPPNVVAQDDTFSDVSPQFAFAYRATSQHMVYVSAARGYKAGGFNPAALPGSEAYGEEHAWHVEGGVKSLFGGGTVSASAAVFQIKWDDLQLNVPNAFVPGQFYIANVGGARSSGVEFDLAARPRSDLDLFAAFGVTRARFSDGTTANGADVSNNRLPYTPDYTATFGGQLTRAITSAISGYGRAEIVLTGSFEYDENNTQSQERYSIVNLRAGGRLKRFFAEAWVRNALDTSYVPIAIPYPGFAPSGFIGENGRPRTLGVSLGATF
jgi:iron complex outermembrane recepter protein